HLQMIRMGALCEQAITQTNTALLEGDKELANSTIALDQEIDLKEREIEGLCLKLLLQQQPVAGDLRRISAALKMITDMERIGDQAADIAEISLLMVKAREGSIRDRLIREMAKATAKMVTESIDAYVRQDLVLAAKVMKDDDIVDGLFDQIKNELVENIRSGYSDGSNTVNVLMIAKYFERIGDHATNIAEWVEFAVTGRKP
ncbi:MAG: phosphate signaling complex protein PhoU, partial [Peptococcaceae bacterium]|nr:phosphate signaling complex protein PhoU [Peptococcaceae bacterium]